MNEIFFFRIRFVFESVSIDLRNSFYFVVLHSGNQFTTRVEMEHVIILTKDLIISQRRFVKRQIANEEKVQTSRCS